MGFVVVGYFGVGLVVGGGVVGVDGGVECVVYRECGLCDVVL